MIQGGVPSGAVARALVERGNTYAVYIHHGTPGYGHTGPRLLVPRTGSQRALNRQHSSSDLPQGSYKVEWVGTRTGKVEKSEEIKSSGGRQTLVSPAYTEDIALRVRKVQGR